MKILNRKEFLALPAGIVYSGFEPCIFHGLFVKENDPQENDYEETSLIGNVKCEDSSEFAEKII